MSASDRRRAASSDRKPCAEHGRVLPAPDICSIACRHRHRSASAPKMNEAANGVGRLFRLYSGRTGGHGPPTRAAASLGATLTPDDVAIVRTGCAPPLTSASKEFLWGARRNE
jgi:hypothetical protein